MAIKLDGIPIADLGIEIFTGSSEEILSTRDRTVTIPERHGAIDFGSDLSPVSFNYKAGFISATTAIEREKAIRTFIAYMSDTTGRPKYRKLIKDSEPDKYYNVRISGRISPEKVKEYAFFDLPLTAFDPFAHAELAEYDETYLYDALLEHDTGLIYPNSRTVHDWAFLSPNQMLYMGEREWSGFVWTYPRHTSGQYNYGQTTPLIIEISGNVTNPKITNYNNDQYIQINTTLSNQVLLIDGEKMTVTIDGVNALNDMTGDFIDMDPGNNGFFFDGTNQYAHVTYKWEHKFF